MVPDFYAHADPPPIVDGDRVRRPEPLPAEYLPPRRGGLVATIAACALIVLVLMVAGIAGLVAL